MEALEDPPLQPTTVTAHRKPRTTRKPEVNLRMGGTSGALETALPCPGELESDCGLPPIAAAILFCRKSVESWGPSLHGRSEQFQDHNGRIGRERHTIPVSSFPGIGRGVIEQLAPGAAQRSRDRLQRGFAGESEQFDVGGGLAVGVNFFAARVVSQPQSNGKGFHSPNGERMNPASEHWAKSR